MKTKLSRKLKSIYQQENVNNNVNLKHKNIYNKTFRTLVSWFKTVFIPKSFNALYYIKKNLVMILQRVSLNELVNDKSCKLLEIH